MSLPEIKTFTREIGGKELSIEVGRVAGLANASCLVKYGDLVLLCTATMARDRMRSNCWTGCVRTRPHG